jgi:hypothetical protein
MAFLGRVPGEDGLEERLQSLARQAGPRICFVKTVDWEREDVWIPKCLCAEPAGSSVHIL